MNSTVSTKVKEHGFNTIKRIKSKGKGDEGKGWKLEGEISSDED